MQRSIFLLAFCTLGYPVLFSQTVTQTFSAPKVQVNGQPLAATYPATVTVSGMPAKMTDLKVKLKGLSGEEDDFEVLLESPDGTHCILYSDAEDVIFFALYDLQLGMGATTVWPYPNANNLFLPPNTDTGSPDVWPAPGPGQVDQPHPTLAVFEGKNPNGTWKLYLVDNEAPYSIGMINGFDLEITAGSATPCVRPGLVKNLVPQPFSAQVEWDANGQSNFDLLIGASPLAVPGAGTTPTLSNLNTPSASLSGLLPSREYEIYIRTTCSGSSKSQWVGPFQFRTKDNLQPLCNAKQPIAGCDTVYLTSPVAGNLNTQPNCNGAPALEGGEYMFEFTPAETGDYYLESTSGGNRNFYYSRNAGCDAADFQCFDFFLPNLAAGVPVKILVDQASPDPAPGEWFFIQRSGLQSYLPTLQSTASTYVVLGYLGHETVYAPAPFQPTAATPPTETLPWGEPFHRTTVPMQPNTTYHLWQRTVANGQNGCWVGPLVVHTRPDCGKLYDFSADNVSGNAVDFRFKSQGISGSNFSLFYGKNPLSTPEVVTNNYTQLGINAPLVNGEHKFTLNNLDPNVDYQAYFRPNCPGPTDWFGPVDFSTGIKCNPQSQPLAVGQPVTLQFQPGFPLYDLGCRSYYLVWGQTSFARFKPATTGVYGFRQTNAVNTTGIEHFVHYALHEIVAECDDEHWQCLAETNINTAEIFYSDTLVAGKTYLIQATPTYQGNPNAALQVDLEIAESPGACPGISLLEVQTGGAGSATLGWQIVPGAASYEIAYGKANQAFSPASAGNNTLTISDPAVAFASLSSLETNTMYKVWMRVLCSPGETSAWTAPHLFSTAVANMNAGGLVTKCSPTMDDGNQSRHFDRWSFRPLVDGKYFFWADFPDFDGRLSLHEGIFYGPNFYSGLIADALLSNPGGVAGFSADLQAGKTYSLVAAQLAPTTAFSGKVNTLLQGRVRFFIGGPGSVGAAATSDVQGRSFGDHGLVQRIYGETFAATMGCPDTLGWVHYLHDGGTEDYPKDDILLLSIHSNGQDIGRIDDGTLTVTDYRQPGPSGYSVLMTNPPALYATNPDGWFVMNKWWLADPKMQPSADVSVRYYFEDSEFQSLRNAIQQSGGAPPAQYSDLYFYKINGPYDPSTVLGHAGIPAAAAYDADGFWQYANGPVASASAWALGASRAGEPYCEMVIARFSGGGGGAAGSPGGAFGSVRVEETAGFGENPLVYPNPVTDELHVEFAAGTGSLKMPYEMFDLSGASVMRGTLEGTGADIRCGHLATGAYFLKIRTAHGTSISRIMVAGR